MVNKALESWTRVAAAGQRRQPLINGPSGGYETGSVFVCLENTAAVVFSSVRHTLRALIRASAVPGQCSGPLRVNLRPPGCIVGTR